MDSKQAFTRFTRRVTIEKTILTYRFTARELGITVREAKALLAAYLETDQAKERGVSAVYLLSGFLKKDEAKKSSQEDAMDVDGEGATQQSQAAEDENEVVPVRTMMLVPADELEVKLALFTRPPSSHVYALTPTPLTTPQLSLLHTASLSLVSSSAREKWKDAPTGDAAAYGGILHPDGVKKRKAGAKIGPTPPVSNAGPSAVKKEKEETKPDVKGKGKEKAPEKGKGKEIKKKAADAGPKIGERRGLFSRSFDEPALKKKKGKGKASSDEEDSDEEDDESEEDVKPKKTIPAKRKSSPTVSRSNSVSTSSSFKPAAKLAPAKKTVDISFSDDDDDEAWAAMDDAAMMQMEQDAQKQADEKKKKAAASAAGGSAMKKGPPAGKKETKEEREKRELEEMMMEDDAMEVDKKPVVKKAPDLNRSTSSSSSFGSSNKKPAAAAKPKEQGQASLKGFFGKK
ncbi:hypothetical protein JCM8547_007425 [Rhodosporidiobolus lusitaniae]